MRRAAGLLLATALAAGALPGALAPAAAQPRKDVKPTVPVITAAPPPSREVSDVARKVMEGESVVDPKSVEMGSVSGDNDPEIAGPRLSEGAFYGPPAPKADKGRIAEAEWTEPNDLVPPALEEAVVLVSRNYPSTRAGRAALRAAEQDVNAAKWLRFPSIQGNLAYLDDLGSPQPQVVVETPLWSGGRIESQIRRARANEDATSAQYIETIQDLAVATTQTYFQVASLTLREQLLKESLGEHERLVETMVRRVEQEISPVADLELARSRSAQIEQQYTVTRAQRQSALRFLAELIADPTFELGPIPYYNPDAELTNREALEDQAVAYDPTLQRLRSQADIARADLAARKASILPQVNAQYSYDDVFGNRVGLVVRSQTTGGLSQISDINSANLRITAALENIRVAEQQLRRDIESAIINYEAAKKRAQISRTSASTASRVSASYTRQFIAGRRSWLDVMNALREAVNAEVDRTDAEITVMATATLLQLQSGRWRPIFDDKQDF